MIKYAWEYLHGSEQRRQTLPGSNYFNKIKSFGESHCLLGEKHIEFVKFSCDEPGDYITSHEDYMVEGKLGTDEEIKQFSKTFIVYEVLVKKYVDHLKILEINKKKRAEKRKRSKKGTKSTRITTGLPCLMMVF
jgi:hypothetical protein